MKESLKINHPIDSFFSPDLMPSVWCPGCGIGTVVYTFIQAIEEAKIDVNKICVVSGNGCVGKVAKYMNFKSYSITNDSIINYAEYLKSRNPDKKVFVFSNNPDFLLSDSKDFMEVGKRNTEMVVIHINNCIYNINEKGFFPISPFMKSSADKKFDLPFNIPYLAELSGAVYVARWTPLRAGWLKYSIMDAISKKGFSVIEVISPCVIYFTTDRRIGDAVEQMKFYSEYFIMKQDESVKNLDIRNQKIIIGKFVDR
ncbi:MAG: hypothetical protein ISS28_07460 [Candidatus Cloacimonetes bacterium]|nr:hypothetical protein [Candidatus Cloacimonadota bacterium]MBL7086912.1 hypothetical protein [Candidatus Cloacimonadota bacterium]